MLVLEELLVRACKFYRNKPIKSTAIINNTVICTANNMREVMLLHFAGVPNIFTFNNRLYIAVVMSFLVLQLSPDVPPINAKKSVFSDKVNVIKTYLSRYVC